MGIPSRPGQDVLAEPARARLFELLTDLRRPATSDELSQLTGRHPNTVRVQLRRLADAGLVERTPLREGRGRPRHMWVIAATGKSVGDPAEHPRHLSRWLARALGTESASLGSVERTGAEIGGELAPPAGTRGVNATMGDVLTRMGFQPRAEALGDHEMRFELAHCPYRHAARENQPVICTLHRGITRGLLAQLDSRATLTSFVPKDPMTAGCLIDIALPQA